jgi:hypothetical protein
MYKLPLTAEIIRYLHASAGFPTKTTWLKAIGAGNYVSWPGLTAKAFNKYFPESDETQQGHMRNVKQGIRSTKERKTETVIKDGVELPNHSVNTTMCIYESTTPRKQYTRIKPALFLYDRETETDTS